MLLPLILLTLGSTFFGYLTHETFLGIGSTIYQGAIFTHPNNIALLDGSMIPTSVEGNIIGISTLKYLPLVTLLILITI
jgi:hypothetical protein